jgi:hypothetical protein
MEQNANISLLPSAGGNIMAMRGGGAPVGYNPDVSVLPATSNSVPIVDMKGGDDTSIDPIMPIGAAAYVTTTGTTLSTNPSKKEDDSPPEKTIRFILFDKTFENFSIEQNEASQKILDLLGSLNDAEKSAALQEIYNGIENLRTIKLNDSPYLKRIFIRMGLNYAKEKGELKEEPLHPEQTGITLAFSDNKVTVTLIIKCEQLPSCRQTNLPMAAAATVMIQKGGNDTRTISLFGEEYTFSKRPTVSDITTYKELLTELEVDKKDSDFKARLLGEIYDGCYTDGPIISRRDCSTFGTLLEELGQTYAEKMHEMLGRTPLLKKKGEKQEGSVKRKELDNGDIELTFTFSNFGKQADAESENENVDASPDQVSTHGMINKNNACFCISVIQLLFSIPEIRTAMKEYKCEVFEEVSKLIKTVNYNIPAVNQDGVLCALFKLFEELGKNMALFSTSTAGALSKGDVPYELLGYIMKNFERDSIVNTRKYRVSQQEDAEIFLTFLFGIFDAKGVTIRPLFQFTQEIIISKVEKAVNQPEDKKNQQTVWIIPDKDSHAFKTSYDGTRTQDLLQYHAETESLSKMPADVPYRVTLTLENNPYLLVRPSNPNKDLSGIPLILSIQKDDNMKQFMLYGMIRKSGSTDSGHYVYDRQDLASNKHILYNDTVVTLFDDEIQMKAAGDLNAYLLVYMEVESSPIEASASAPAPAPASASASAPASAPAMASTKVIASAPSMASTSAPVSAPASAPASSSVSAPAKAIASAPAKAIASASASVTSQQLAQQAKQLAQQAQQQAKQRELESKQLKQLRQQYMQRQSKQRRSEKEAEQQRAKQSQRELASAPRSAAMILSEAPRSSAMIMSGAPSVPTHTIVIKPKAGGSITDTNDDTPHRRTLRASKQSPKKRTLRAAKKLRQLLNST